MAFSPPSPPMFEVNVYNTINTVTNELKVFNLDLFCFNRVMRTVLIKVLTKKQLNKRKCPAQRRTLAQQMSWEMMTKDVLCQRTQELQMMSAKGMKRKVKQKGVLGLQHCSHCVILCHV